MIEAKRKDRADWFEALHHELAWVAANIMNAQGAKVTVKDLLQAKPSVERVTDPAKVRAIAEAAFGKRKEG